MDGFREDKNLPETYKMASRSTEDDASSSKTHQVPAVTSTIEKKRRCRTTFTRHQLQVLEEKFQVQQYMVGKQRIELAKSLGLNEIQVKVWFQNRRIKWRRQQREVIKRMVPWQVQS